jgi:hypothetical protein
MTEPTRVAGSGELADGSIVTWTVAEGRRGRRWREVIVNGRATAHALLFETDPAGRFSHLELARDDGLWTFHPEMDGTLHGNHVRADGPVRHVKGWPFAAGDALLIEGSPIAAAALAWGRAGTVAAGSSIEVAGVIIRSDGRLEHVERTTLQRLDATHWRVGQGTPIEVDAEGLPVLSNGRRHPLEDP